MPRPPVAAPDPQYPGETLFSINGDVAAKHSSVISLPNADGQIEQFEVYEASNFDTELQAQFPQIRAYSGKGITEAQLTTIFERFTRIAIEQEGQGLGLAIVDSIAKYYHIEVTADSKIDFGTTFTVQFPLDITKKS